MTNNDKNDDSCNEILSELELQITLPAQKAVQNPPHNIDLECDSNLELSEDEESKHNEEQDKNFVILLKGKRDNKTKKIEFLRELIRDEFRIDYLPEDSFNTKVDEIYEKFNDFQKSLEDHTAGKKSDESESVKDSSSETSSKSPVVAKSSQVRHRDVKVFSPPKIMFSGPDERNHYALEQKFQSLLFTAQNKVLICNYTIANGVLSFEIAKTLKRRCGK